MSESVKSSRSSKSSKSSKSKKKKSKSGTSNPSVINEVASPEHDRQAFRGDLSTISDSDYSSSTKKSRKERNRPPPMPEITDDDDDDYTDIGQGHPLDYDGDDGMTHGGQTYGEQTLNSRFKYTTADLESEGFSCRDTKCCLIMAGIFFIVIAIIVSIFMRRLIKPDDAKYNNGDQAPVVVEEGAVVEGATRLLLESVRYLRKHRA